MITGFVCHSFFHRLRCALHGETLLFTLENPDGCFGYGLVEDKLIIPFIYLLLLYASIFFHIYLTEKIFLYMLHRFKIERFYK